MRSVLKRMLAAMLAVAAGCGGARQADKTNGRVKFSGQLRANAPNAGAAPAVCATFTLRPFSLDAAGHQTPAGSAVTLTSTAASQTDAILGCVDQGPGGANPNWGYNITATSFVDCATGAPIAGLQPTIASAVATIECGASRDVSLPIVVDVSIPQANSAGYIDISVGVNATEVQTGCKNAELGPDGKLHFGESYIDPNGSIPLGLVAFDLVRYAGLGVTQWGGTVNAATGATAPIDTYYTGINDLALTTSSLLYQTFLPGACQAGEYASTRQAQCITKVSGGAPATIASLADVFMQGQQGYLAASLTSAANLELYWGPLAPLMDASVTPAAVGYGSVTVSEIAAPAGSTFTGVFVDRSVANQLDITGVDATLGPVIASLTFTTSPASAWSLGSWSPVSSLSQADLTCRGIFAAGPPGCFTPKACGCPTGLVHDYQLQGSYADALGGPALVPGSPFGISATGGVLLGTNGYSFEQDPWLGPTQVVAGQNEGLSLTGALCDPTQYQIELQFSMPADVSGTGWNKVIEFSNLNTDPSNDPEVGLFVVGDGAGGGTLLLGGNGPFQPSGTHNFTFGSPHTVVLTRYGANSASPGRFTVSLDGAIDIDAIDTLGTATFNDPGGKFYFFTEEPHDVHGQGGYPAFHEVSAGTVTRIRISGP